MAVGPSVGPPPMPVGRVEAYPNAQISYARGSIRSESPLPRAVEENGYFLRERFGPGESSLRAASPPHPGAASPLLASPLYSSLRPPPPVMRRDLSVPVILEGMHERPAEHRDTSEVSAAKFKDQEELIAQLMERVAALERDRTNEPRIVERPPKPIRKEAAGRVDSHWNAPPRRKPEPARKPRVGAGRGVDAVDATLHSWQTANPDKNVSIEKVKDGVYIVDGSQKIVCLVRGNAVLVRRGGGYTNLMQFLDDWCQHYQRGDSAHTID